MIESTYQVKSTINVFSRDCTGLARTGHGDYIQAVPRITLTAEFDGKWSSKASMDSDLHECLDRLLLTYDRRMSCTQEQCSSK